MSDSPHDARSLIDWFRATEIVRHNGTREPREPRMAQDEAERLAARISQPSYYGRMDDKETWTAHTIWEAALSSGLFMGNRFGWIDRKGRFWGCGHAAHELLLHFLGVDIREVEAGGWIRISMSGPQSIFCPSEAQMNTLILMGLEGVARNLMYEGIEPSRAAVKAAQVKELT